MKSYQKRMILLKQWRGVGGLSTVDKGSTSPF
jgi:hypothetical protein